MSDEHFLHGIHAAVDDILFPESQPESLNHLWVRDDGSCDYVSASGDEYMLHNNIE